MHVGHNVVDLQLTVALPGLALVGLRGERAALLVENLLPVIDDDVPVVTRVWVASYAILR